MTALRKARDRTGEERASGNAWARLYRGQTNYDFINRWKIWFAISGTIIVIGLAALGVRGLNFSIDFKGGTVWEVPTTTSVATVRADLGHISSTLDQATITQLTNRQTGKVNIEVQAAATLTSNSALVQDVTKELADVGHVSIDQVTLNAIGPSWGSDITSKAVEAVVVFLVLISVCIAAYFETKMAAAALVALLHDMLVTVGIYALSGFQVSPDTVIAFLTVLGYSLYDTIVVFDKVKENTRGLASTNRVTYTDVVNLSMNQVLARSINTSFVAIMPVFCILVIGSWILGASALNDFGLALFIGLMSGAYSSIFIASPILAILKEREPRYVEIRRRLAAYPASRQVLTPSTVAHGVLVGAGRTVVPANVTVTEGAAPSGPNGAAMAGASNGGAATANNFESYAGPPRSRPAAARPAPSPRQGPAGRPSPSGRPIDVVPPGVLGPEAAPADQGGPAPGPGSAVAPDAPAPAAPAVPGQGVPPRSRNAPPRARKKVPRRR
jgi:preprotein translocase subunit SecF